MFSLLLGHLVGDFLLQNKWMSEKKTQSSFRCVVHCTVYTVAVCVVCPLPGWQWPLLVFLSHYFIDRYSLAEKWLKLINGRTLNGFLKRGHLGIEAEDYETNMNYRILRGGFNSLVYCAADNTMHLLLMYYGYRLLSKT